MHIHHIARDPETAPILPEATPLLAIEPSQSTPNQPNILANLIKQRPATVLELESFCKALAGKIKPSESKANEIKANKTTAKAEKIRLSANHLYMLNEQFKHLQSLSAKKPAGALLLAIENAKLRLMQLIAVSLENEAAEIIVPNKIIEDIKQFNQLDTDSKSKLKLKFNQLNAKLNRLATLKKRKLTADEIDNLKDFLDQLKKSPARKYLGDTAQQCQERIEEILENSKKKSSTRLFGTIITMLCGVILAGIEGFDSGQALFGLFTGIAAIPLFILAGILSFIEATNFVSTYFDEFKEDLGSLAFSTRKKFLSLRNKQLDCMSKRVFTHLPLPGKENDKLIKMDSSFTGAYYELTTTIINDLTSCKNQEAIPKEISPFKKISPIKAICKKLFIAFVTALSAVSFVGYGLFTGQALLAFCGAAAVAFSATPPGWIVCGAFAGLSLIFFITTQRKLIRELVDSIFGGPKQIAEAQIKFCDEADSIKRSIESVNDYGLTKENCSLHKQQILSYQTKRNREKRAYSVDDTVILQGRFFSPRAELPLSPSNLAESPSQTINRP